MNYIIREISEEEYSLLEDFLYEAIFVPEGISAPPKSIIRQPKHLHDNIRHLIHSHPLIFCHTITFSPGGVFS